MYLPMMRSPANLGWYAQSTRSPALLGRHLGWYAQTTQSPALLGRIPGGLGRFGQNGTQILGLTVDPTLLALGLGALLVGVYLFGGGRPKRKARRLRQKIARSQERLSALRSEYATA
jgi:hypothetical protein